jgi:hypothetical protein
MDQFGLQGLQAGFGLFLEGKIANEAREDLLSTTK